VPFRFDLIGFDHHSRPYALGNLCIETAPLSPEESKKFKQPFARLRRRLPWLGRLLPDSINRVNERQFPFDPAILETPLPAYFDGYWQTEKYFAPVADAIRRQFQLAVPMTAPRLATAAEIAAVNAVSVHVRRGDYATDPKTLAFHGTCAPEWYERAMNLMIEKVPAPHFFIFSDDPEWARANLPQKGPTTYVDPQSDKRDWEDMHLMALCRHHIIANSSFSWWGAWLNPSPGKQVIAPLRWFNEAPHDTRDITPDTWTRL
jgi:hypothetical protein